MSLSLLSHTSVHAHHAAVTQHVFIVDHDLSVQQTLEPLVREAGWLPISFACAEEFLNCPPSFTPSCLVLDICLPGLDGLQLQERLADRTDMPVIFITSHSDTQSIVRAMRAGAIEFLRKPVQPDELLAAIGIALDRSRRAMALEHRKQVLRTRFDTLTARERQVMQRVISGWLNKQIACDLCLSEITIKAHRGKVMRKMLAHSLPELVNMALDLSLDAIALQRGLRGAPVNKGS